MSVETQPAPQTAPAPRPGAANMRFDPVTRVSGPLAFHVSADFDSRTVSDATAIAGAFRGYENILVGRDARDGVFVSSRACGVCGGAHPIAAAQALEMACAIQPPPMAIVGRNFLAAVECLYDLPTHLFVRAGPDYAEPVVRETSPELWSQAENTPAAGAAVHGYARVADIMTALTRNRGALYIEALEMSRVAREAYVLIGGKYPHPQTITPGGVSSNMGTTPLATTHFNLGLLRVVRFVDYARIVATVWDDLVNFFLEAGNRYAEVGAGAKNFLDPGLWDDPFAFDASYANAAEWGARRAATPGAVVGGELQTTDLPQIDAGVEEFVERSFYEDWGPEGYSHDALGNPLSARHPYNKQTIPRPADPDPQGRYSWSTAARWNGQPMETGAQARMWITALAGRQPHTSFVEATGHSLRMLVPKASMPESVVEWRVPERWNALERNRARAYALAHATLVAYESVVTGLDLSRIGGPDARVFTPYEIPREHVMAVGWWGGGRGWVSHHLELDGRVIRNYQIIGPSTFSGSPRDAAGTPGPCEAAVMATPLVSADGSQHGIDVLRTIRSFDLCMFCATQ